MKKDLLKEVMDKKKEKDSPATASAEPVSDPKKIDWKSVNWKNVAINFPFWLWQKSKFVVESRLTQLKVLVFVYYARIRRGFSDYKRRVQMYIAGYRTITGEQFITMFPPKKGHKPCNGQGWNVVMLPNKMKTMRFCACVTDKYKASGKKFLIKNV